MARMRRHGTTVAVSPNPRGRGLGLTFEVTLLLTDEEALSLANDIADAIESRRHALATEATTSTG
ncbi:hypothetical protein ACFW9U_17405 [Rhodococcus aetherivorans]|uniref:hypothetical protein n=1 Tax=Rhodococcus aetherivorans TaxID=191292 RepID=UPI00366DBB37